MYAIEVKRLVKDFELARRLPEFLRAPLTPKTKRVLDGVDLKVEEGALLGILGPNGAGKTTLLKIIATLIRPTAGEVSVCGNDLTRSEEEVRDLVAYSFSESRSFYWRLNGRQNLEFFAALNNVHGGNADRLIENIAQRLDIGSYLDQPFSVYSAGVRQRFALARALLRDSRILLLDEPTRSVDPVETRQMWSLIREVLVREDGKTVILVTHQLREASAVCDRVAVLDGGRIQTEYSAKELRDRVLERDTLTITLEGFHPTELAGLRAIPGVHEVTLANVNGHQRLDVTCEQGELAVSELIAAITASGASVRGLSQRPAVRGWSSRSPAEQVSS